MAGSSGAGYDPKVANLWAARIIPVLLVGIVGYVSWVIIELVCVNYLLRPKASASSHLPRPRSAIAVLAVYSILLLLFTTTYFRLLYTVATNPGYVERGPQWYTKNEGTSRPKGPRNGGATIEGHDLRKPRKRGASRSKTRHSGDGSRKQSKQASDNSVQHDGHPQSFGYMSQPTISTPTAIDESPRRLHEHYTKDVFVCQGDGRPIWCSSCMNWKPDRAHHCREIDRCVRKMDHFCPWVGGVVGETTFKFFIQFTSWAAVYCTFILVIMAIVTVEERKVGKVPDGHWIATLSMSALFSLFTLGMSGTSLQFAFLNTTTIENLSRRSKVWQMAVYMARPPSSGNRIGFPSVTYPLTDDTSIPQPSSSKRTFAILHSKPGENPWDLGPFANFKSVMGVHWYDWLIPLRCSPCRDHSRGDSEFELGPVVDRMRIDAGLLSPRDPPSKSVSRWEHYRPRIGKQRNVEEGDGSKTRDGSTRFPRERGRDDAMNYEGRNASIELRDSNRIHDE